MPDRYRPVHFQHSPSSVSTARCTASSPAADSQPNSAGVQPGAAQVGGTKVPSKQLQQMFQAQSAQNQSQAISRQVAPGGQATPGNSRKLKQPVGQPAMRQQAGQGLPGQAQPGQFPTSQGQPSQAQSARGNEFRAKSRAESRAESQSVALTPSKLRPLRWPSSKPMQAAA